MAPVCFVVRRLFSAVCVIATDDGEVFRDRFMLPEGKLQADTGRVRDDEVALFFSGREIDVVADGVADGDERMNAQGTYMNVSLCTRYITKGQGSQQQNSKKYDLPELAAPVSVRMIKVVRICRQVS